MSGWLMWSALIMVLLMGCGTGDVGMATPSEVVVVATTAPDDTFTATVAPSHTSSPAPSPTASPTWSVTASPTVGATVSPVPDPTLSPLPTAEPSIQPSAVPLVTEAPAPTLSPTKIPGPSPTRTPEAGSGSRDPAAIQLDIHQIVDGLDMPVAITSAGDGSGRLFIAEKKGLVRVVQNGVLANVPFLDITDRASASSSEQGLLGLAFHPAYVANGLFFADYTDRQGDTVVSRFRVSDDPNRAEPGSEAVLLTLDQPAANHNGGHLAFGPDGYLYIGTGDGGGAGDQFGNGQNAQSLLGAILRLDVDGGQPYAVPQDNPYVGQPTVRDEIWALGLRNPWRYSFDRKTGDLYIADVGQNQYEEVNLQAANSRGGQNYGWPIMEGLHCFPADRPCDRGGLALPIQEYDHGQGCSVTGGYVYRGLEYPAMDGIYLFADYCSGSIWGMAPDGGGGWRAAQLAQVNGRISSFGEDDSGELYYVDMAGGTLFRIASR